MKMSVLVCLVLKMVAPLSFIAKKHEWGTLNWKLSGMTLTISGKGPMITGGLSTCKV